MSTRVLVVGATRILRPAVEELVASGGTVVAVARSPGELRELAAAHPGRVVPAAADYADTNGFRDAVRASGATPDAAVVYAPLATDATRSVLQELVCGPVVELLTSDIAAGYAYPFMLDCLPPAPHLQWYRLVLGWTEQRNWHTRQQISTAALSVLADRRDWQLGVLTPFDDRPAR